MSHEIEPGAVGVLEWTVAEQHCTRRGSYDIFSTPNLVRLLEEAAIEALAPYLAVGQSSVGSRVDVTHLAPTVKGQRVRATATVTEIDRRRVAFTVEVSDDQELIGLASHERFVVDVSTFEVRLAEKSKGLS